MAPPQRRYRVVMMGDAGVGKTALVSQFMTSEYMHTYDASLGKLQGKQYCRLFLFTIYIYISNLYYICTVCVRRICVVCSTSYTHPSKPQANPLPPSRYWHEVNACVFLLSVWLCHCVYCGFKCSDCSP